MDALVFPSHILQLAIIESLVGEVVSWPYEPIDRAEEKMWEDSSQGDVFDLIPLGWFGQVPLYSMTRWSRYCTTRRVSQGPPANSSGPE